MFKLNILCAKLGISFPPKRLSSLPMLNNVADAWLLNEMVFHYLVRIGTMFFSASVFFNTFV